MRALTLTLVVLGLLVGSLPAQEPAEPGVFVYEYDEVNDTYLRSYYATQAEAQEALRPSRELALTAVTNLKAQIGSSASVNTEAAAEWLVFCEQWHFYQRWLAEEYDLGDQYLEDNAAEIARLRFAAVPGAQLRFEQAGDAEQAVADAAAGLGGRGGGAALGFEGDPAAEFAALEGGFAGGGGAQAQPAPPEEAQAAITLENFAYSGGVPSDEQWKLTILTLIQEGIQALIADNAQQHYDDLAAILDTIDIEQERRQRREAAIAARQRDIHNLREIILDREAATEVEIEGRTYLFSQEPLRRQPENIINIPTPNLTPYDMFNSDGTPRQE
jgi:hypothetical protein